jgi:hypothetical protein
VSGAPAKGSSRLGVVIDGEPVPDELAREVWERFSDYMEDHKGDLGGFAQAEGFLSVHPRSDGGRAVLVFSRTEPQEAYGTAAPGSGVKGGGARPPKPGAARRGGPPKR